MSVTTTVSQSLKSAGRSFVDMFKHTGTAAHTAFQKADQAVLAAKGAHGGTYWGAIKGVSKAHPVSATAAGVGLAAGTVYVGSKVFGSHTDRVMRERESHHGHAR